jgi:hypothetical protein
MSVGLRVKLTRAIDLHELFLEIGETLRELLHLRSTPLIVAEEYRDGAWLPLISQILNSESPIVGFAIQGEPEMASVSVYTRRPDRFTADDWTKDEVGDVASIEVAGPRTSLSFALVAAVATVLGRKCNSQILDDLPFYTARFDSSPDEFAEAVSVHRQFDDYHSAAVEFGGHLLR